MKKSNKGFTLVELLAAIVIMGILILIAAPTIVNMVNNNRDKMYIVDAQKLISLTENKINASSSIIEKPDSDQAIIISMNYLSKEEFDVAPNRGEYVLDASYVVVTNNKGKLEYSVAIIEKLLPKKDNKDSTYRGIQLVKGNELDNKNAAAKLVNTIKYEDLRRINDDNSPVDEKYIKGKINLSGSLTISHIYNTKELPEDALQVGSEPPTIVKATMSSTSGKKYNSLDATLSLTAEDRDTDVSELLVYISTESYDDAIQKKSSGEKYGEDLIYTKTFDFSSSGFNYKDGGEINLYIVVKDPEGNIAKSTYLYDIHKNTPPVINKDESRISKLPEDKFNMPEALIQLSVEDDIDTNESLEVCITTDAEADTCTNYKKYNQEFPKNTKNYKFSNSKCALSGQTLNLKIFVKDSLGEVTSEVLGPYKIYQNEAPQIESVSIVSAGDSFPNEGNLNSKITIVAKDDFTDPEDLKLDITNGKSKFSGQYDSDSINFELDGDYDGLTREVRITLTDECGGVITKDYTTYSVYENKRPEISDLKIESSEEICNNPELCPSEEGGNVKANVTFNVSDDLDNDDLENNISICIAESMTACQQDANFKKYANYSSGIEYVFNKNIAKPYTGETKTIYVVAKDSKNKTTSASQTYKLYKNKPPVAIKQINVEGENGNSSVETLPKITTTSDEGNNISLAKFELDAEDDLDDTLLVNICYRLEGSTQETCLGYKNYQDDYIIDFKETNYKGQKYIVYARIKDSYGEENEKPEEYSTTYELYKDAVPVIDSVVARIDGGIPIIELNEDSTEEEKRECSIEPDENGNEKFYDRTGKETTETEYKKQCLSCSKEKTKNEEDQDIIIYYDKNGNETTEANYNNICNYYVKNSLPSTSEDKLRVSFVVNDLYDTYSVCISKDPNICTDYVKQPNGEGFDGTSGKSNMVYFVDKAGIKYFNKSLNSVDDYYLFAKDSHDNIAVVKVIDEDDQVLTSNGYYFTATKKDTMCKDIESKPVRAEYELVSSEKLTAKRCMGQCYYASQEDLDSQKASADEGYNLDVSEKFEKTSDKTAIYKKRLYYLDRFNPTKECLEKDADGNEIEELIEANCSFKDCF